MLEMAELGKLGICVDKTTWHEPLSIPTSGGHFKACFVVEREKCTCNTSSIL